MLKIIKIKLQFQKKKLKKNNEEIARLKEIERDNKQKELEIRRLENKIKDLEVEKKELEKELSRAKLDLAQMEIESQNKDDKIDNLSNDLERERNWRRADTRRYEDNYRAARDEVVYQKRLRSWEKFSLQKERDNDKLVSEYQDTIDKSAIAMLIDKIKGEASPNPTITDYVFKIGDTVYTYREHGAPVNTFKMDVAPFIDNSRTYVPLRYVATAIGADVKWDQNTQTATFNRDGIIANVRLKDKNININNGSVVQMDVMPKLVQNRIFVPIRFVSDIFGNDLNWDQATQTVTVAR